MKFFSWLFNAPSRHYRGIDRYQNGGVWGRLFTILTTTILVGGVFAVEYWLLWYISTLEVGTRNYPLLAIIGIALLGFGLVTVSLDFSATYCYVAFGMAFIGIIGSVAQKISDRRARKNQAAGTSVEQSNSTEKTYKLFDIFIGIYEAILTIGLIIGIIVFAIYYLKSLT